MNIMALPTITPEIKETVNTAINLSHKANAVTVKNADDHISAGKLLSTVRSRIKELTDKRKSLTQPLDNIKKDITALFKPAIDRLETAKKSISKGMLDWEREEEQRRQEEQRKAEEEARKRAEEEALEQAAAAEQAGDTELAAQILEEPVEVAPVRVASTVPRSSTAFSRETWSAEVTDIMALVKAVAAGTVPIAAIKADTVFLNNQARALKKTMNYPGVRAVSSKSMSGRLS